MKTQSAKNKGRILAKWLKNEILKRFTNLSGDDLRVTSSGAGGEDLALSPRARERLPLQFECKSRAAFVGYTFIDQSTQHGHFIPVVIVKANHREPLALLSAEHFLQLLQQKEKHGN